MDGAGAPNKGGTYTSIAAGGIAFSEIDVAPNALTTRLTAAGGMLGVYLDTVSIRDATASIAWSSPSATGGRLEPGGILLRGVDINTYIMCRSYVQTTGQVDIEIITAAGSVLASSTVWGSLYVANEVFITKGAAFGSAIYMKCWRASEPEPPYWQLKAVDPSPASGWIGFRSGRAGGNTNVNPVISHYDFQVENPQSVTVTRAVNGVSRTWPADSDFRLWNPLRLGR